MKKKQVLSYELDFSLQRCKKKYMLTVIIRAHGYK